MAATQAETRPAGAVAGAWRIWDDRAAGDAAGRLARDAELLEAVRAGRAEPTARIWECGRCVAVSRADRRLPHFERAAEVLAAEGWPVLVRESGGAAVPQAPGILCLSLAFRPERSTLESSYALLCEMVARALGALGVEASIGNVPGSFCDGRFDVAVDGRKIAGTAQRWRARPGSVRGAILAHALVLVDVDRAAATRAVNRFYALAGDGRRTEPEAMVTLREALAARGAPLGRGGPALREAARASLAEAARAQKGCR